jgi:hypothetical protein
VYANRAMQLKVHVLVRLTRCLMHWYARITYMPDLQG